MPTDSSMSRRDPSSGDPMCLSQPTANPSHCNHPSDASSHVRGKAWNKDIIIIKIIFHSSGSDKDLSNHPGAVTLYRFYRSNIPVMILS